MANPRNERKRARAEADDVQPASVEDQDLTIPRGSKRAKVDEQRSLFVRSIPPDATNESLTDFFSQYFPVKHAVVVADQKTKQSRGFGFVTFADAEDAAEAKKALDKKEWDGRRIRIDIAERRQRNETGAKSEPAIARPKKGQPQGSTKLIIRNLPWSVKTSEQLSKLFMSFGKVKFADLPNTKGKLKGFGFVTLRGRKNAEKALEAINGKEIDGRTVAVDWAVDKKTWETQQEDQEPDPADSDDETSEEDSEEDDDDIADQGNGNEKRKTETVDEELDADLENFMKNHMQNMDDEESTSEEEEDQDSPGKPAAPKARTTDNSSTVFVRNLPFTTTDEGLNSFFSHFGKVRYARVVMDKTSGQPAGTGFVCFFKETDAKDCIKGAPRSQPQPAAKGKHSILQDESADPDGHYTLDGRLLQIAQAVNKEEASNLADSSAAKRREKDKRRLFLLSEGAISRGTPLYDLLTPTEIQMRQASANQRRKLVQKTPTLHLSLTRLALRNIPRNIDSKELKDLARKAIVGFAKDVKEGKRQPLSKEENARDGKDAKEKEHQRKLKGKGIVRQGKVVFESNQGSKISEKSGAGKSRGYGFIEYTSHHWALMGLRYLNGHQLQDDNGKKHRLIVEFAIENAQVMQRRRALEAQSTQAAQASRNAAGARGGRQSTGAGNKRGQKQENEDNSDNDGDETPKDSKADMKQKLIARKRLMRKKKAVARKQR